MAVSWAAGQKYYPIRYEYGKMGLYALIAGVLYVIGEYVFDFPEAMWVTYFTRTALLILYLTIIVRYERLPVPGLRRRH